MLSRAAQPCLSAFSASYLLVAIAQKTNMGTSNLFKKLRKKLHSKDKQSDPPIKKYAPIKTPIINPATTTAAVNAPPPNVIPDSPPSKVASPGQSTATGYSASQGKSGSYSDSASATATLQGSPKSASVTIEERIRYQKMVLGMTDAQIARALPPGFYQVEGLPDNDAPSGRAGDLAYAYRELAR